MPTQTVTPATATTNALAAVTGGAAATGAGATPALRPWERPGTTTNGLASTSYGGYGGGYGAGSMYGRCAGEGNPLAWWGMATTWCSLSGWVARLVGRMATTWCSLLSA